ncbi:hypothetical protein KEM56_002687 [Ascosphaera pollenicola]|nr:hypothetical protein KEM56_002687 [Ascosphaera pollenicola]
MSLATSTPTVFTSSPSSSSTSLNTKHNGTSTLSLTSSFLSAFSSRHPSSRLSSESSGSTDRYSASILAQRLGRRNSLWQGPSILRNRNLSPHFESLKSRPTTPVEPNSSNETIEGHLLAPSQGSGTSTPQRPHGVFEGLESSHHQLERPVSALPRGLIEDILSNQEDFSEQPHILRNAISLDAMRADLMEANMGTQNTANAPPAWTSPLSPASPNSSRRLQKDNDGKNGMAATPRTEQYIQHLEAQVATLTDSMSSNANNNVIRKVKQLTRERSVLQEELAEWEKQFETRVQSELASARQREAQLAAQIRALQIDNRLKDHKITEQAREIKHTRQSLKDAQSANHELEQRIDDLTGLLAQSPVMLNPRPRAQTVHNKMTSRMSESVLPSPRLPVRPTSMVNGDTKENEITPVRRQSTSLQVPTPTAGSPVAIINEKAAETSSVSLEDSSVFDTTNISSEPSGLRDSTQFSSVSSVTSVGELNPSPENPAKRHSVPAPNRRKMRKFPSGARQLKPLVLQNSSETPEKATGRARCNSYPYPSSVHSHPTPPAYRFPPLSIDLYTIADNELYQESEPTGSPRATHGNRRSRELARARTLNALEGGPHQYQFFEYTLGDLKQSFGEDNDDEFEPSSTDCVIPGASLPSLARHNSNRSLIAHSPPASDVGVEIDSAPADSDTTTLWQQHRSLQSELSENDTSELDGIVISDASKQFGTSFSQSPKTDLRSCSYRYKFRRPTVDRIMEPRIFANGTDMGFTPVLYRGSPFEPSSQASSSASRKPREAKNCLPSSLSPEPATSLTTGLVSTARQIIANTRCRVSQLHDVWLGGFSWILLGLFLHSRDNQSTSGDGALDYAAIYEAPAAHKNQMSLIDGFRLTMTRRLRSKVTNFAAPVIERGRKSGLINTMRCWSHFMTVMLFALGFAARYGPSDLMQVEPPTPKAERCPHCGAGSHDLNQGGSGAARAFRGPPKTDSFAMRA